MKEREGPGPRRAGGAAGPRTAGTGCSLPRVAGVLASLGLAAACASPRWRETHETVPDYAAARPVMIAIRVEGPEATASTLADALYRRLLALHYSPLAPGAVPSPETGFLRVRRQGTEILPEAVLRLEDPGGRVLFRSTVTGYRGDPEGLARALTLALPPKEAAPRQGDLSGPRGAARRAP